MKPHRASGLRQSDPGGMAGVLLVDAGLVLLLIGAVSLVRPLRWLGMRSRKMAALWLAAGLGTLALGALLPARLQRSADRRWLLDDFIPASHFSEHHEIRIAAPPERVFAAVQAVTAREIRFFGFSRGSGLRACARLRNRSWLPPRTARSWTSRSAPASAGWRRPPIARSWSERCSEEVARAPVRRRSLPPSIARASRRP